MSGSRLRALRIGALLLAVATTGRAEEPAPPQVQALASGGGAEFASYGHSCAVVAGDVQCWGAAQHWQVGSAAFESRAPVPHRVEGFAEPASAVAAGATHSCALAGGRVHCWGLNTWRQLGSDSDFALASPKEVPGLPTPATALAAGSVHTCAVAAGAVHCWGRDREGSLGSEAHLDRCGLHQPLPCRAAPERVAGLAGVTAVAIGDAHTCALGDRVSCWGSDERGQLGRGPGGSSAKPVEVPGLAGASAIAAGAAHTCALVRGRVLCWGANDHGQLGDGTTADRARPVEVRGLPDGATRIAAGTRHTCAATGSSVQCWGANEAGQLGSGPSPPRPQPVAVPGLDGPVTALSAGRDHGCALLRGTQVLCWGDDDYGQLGDGRAPLDSPGPVALAAWDTGRLRDRDGDGRITIACLGDSNTHRGESDPPGWCERLPDRLGPARWRSVNRGAAGATVTSGRALVDAGQPLRYALENDAPDAVILAYGTNDLIQGAGPDEVLEAYERASRRIRSSGALAFVALTPPMRAAVHASNERVRVLNERIAELNARLREAIPADRVIDFFGTITPDDLADQVHLNASGHARQAEAAAAALRARAP